MHEMTGFNVNKLSHEKQKEVVDYVDKKLSIYEASPRKALDLYVRKVEEILEDYTIERKVD